MHGIRKIEIKLKPISQHVNKYHSRVRSVSYAVQPIIFIVITVITVNHLKQIYYANHAITLFIMENYIQRSLIKL